MTPACATWGLWVGREIEGNADLGRTTLFVRRGSPHDVLAAIDQHDRVWFCKEWEGWSLVRTAILAHKTVCLEATLDTLAAIPEDVRQAVRVYLKIPVDLKRGDHVCVGPAFADEAFEIGHGRKVAPESYSSDEVLSP